MDTMPQRNRSQVANCKCRQETAALSEDIRRESFLTVSRATTQHEIASYVSDDFDIIIRGSILAWTMTFSTVSGMLTTEAKSQPQHPVNNQARHAMMSSVVLHLCQNRFSQRSACGRIDEQTIKLSLRSGVSTCQSHLLGLAESHPFAKPIRYCFAAKSSVL